MKFVLECECGNKVCLSIAKKKDLQLRDGLETQYFHYDGAEIKNGKLTEVRISCDKCKNWIVMSVD